MWWQRRCLGSLCHLIVCHYDTPNKRDDRFVIVDSVDKYY